MPIFYIKFHSWSINWIQIQKKDYKNVSDDQYSNRFFVNFVNFILFIHWSIDDSFILMMHSTIYQPKNRRFNVSVLILKFIIKTNCLHILFRIFSLILMILSLISTTMILNSLRWWWICFAYSINSYLQTYLYCIMQTFKKSNF